jgi:hypothetical protein
MVNQQRIYYDTLSRGASVYAEETVPVTFIAEGIPLLSLLFGQLNLVQ